jgi:hypothetical protein
VHSILQIWRFQRRGRTAADCGSDPDVPDKLRDAVADDHAEAACAGLRDNRVDRQALRHVSRDTWAVVADVNTSRTVLTPRGFSRIRNTPSELTAAGNALLSA